MHTYEPCIRWVEKVKEVSVDYEETQVNNKIDFISLKFSEGKSDETLWITIWNALNRVWMLTYYMDVDEKIDCLTFA